MRFGRKFILPHFRLVVIVLIVTVVIALAIIEILVNILMVMIIINGKNIFMLASICHVGLRTGPRHPWLHRGQ